MNSLTITITSDDQFLEAVRLEGSVTGNAVSATPEPLRGLCWTRRDADWHSSASQKLDLSYLSFDRRGSTWSTLSFQASHLEFPVSKFENSARKHPAGSRKFGKGRMLSSSKHGLKVGTVLLPSDSITFCAIVSRPKFC